MCAQLTTLFPRVPKDRANHMTKFWPMRCKLMLVGGVFEELPQQVSDLSPPAKVMTLPWGGVGQPFKAKVSFIAVHCVFKTKSP